MSLVADSRCANSAMPQDLVCLYNGHVFIADFCSLRIMAAIEILTLLKDFGMLKMICSCKCFLWTCSGCLRMFSSLLMVQVRGLLFSLIFSLFSLWTVYKHKIAQTETQLINWRVFLTCQSALHKLMGEKTKQSLTDSHSYLCWLDLFFFLGVLTSGVLASTNRNRNVFLVIALQPVQQN